MNQQIKEWRIWFHGLSIANLGGSVFLQMLTLVRQFQQGYAHFVEPNLIIRTTELGMTVYAAFYLAYLVYMIKTGELR